jgi:hypothetical protein
MRSILFSALAICCAGVILPAQGSAWTQRASVTTPTGSNQNASLAFDAARGVCVYCVSSSSQIATFDWNGTAWTSRGTTAVSSLGEFRFVYDVARAVHVGVSYNGSSLKTHEWNNATSAWVLRSVAFPVQRSGYSLAYDAGRSRVVLFGGRDPTYTLADTYEYDGVSWQLRSTGGTGAPRGRGDDLRQRAPARRALRRADGERTAQGLRRHLGVEWLLLGRGIRHHGAAGADDGRARVRPRARQVRAGRRVHGQRFGAEGNLGTEHGQLVGDTTSTQPYAFDMPAMTYDPLRGRVVLCGVRSGTSNSASECWERAVVASSQPQWTAFGTGCAGSAGVPTLAPGLGQLPSLGKPFTVQVGNVPFGPLRLTYGMLGASNAAWSGVPLPFDLGLLGMPGCTLYTGAEIVTPLTATGGVASWTMTLPYDIGLIGARAYQQALIVDPGTNLLGMIVSNAGEIRLGL